MSHTYLIDLYELIDQRLEEVASELKTENAAPRPKTDPDYLKGRSECLIAFKHFLATHYNNKLPRRIRSKYSVEIP